MTLQPNPNPIALSADDRQRVEHVERIARDGRSGLPKLLELLDDKSWAVRRAVVAALARLGDAALPALADVVRSKRGHEARLAAAVDALVASSGDVRQATLALMEANAPPPVVCDALQILGRRKEAEALDAVVRYARAADDNVAVAAIEAMSQIGGERTVEPLLAALSSKNFFRAFPAIDALGRTGDPRAIAPLAALVEDPLYAAEATRALGRTAQDAAVPALAPLLTKRSDSLVRTAAMALVDLAELQSVRFGTPRSMRESLANALPVNVASTRVAACFATASPSEMLALVRVLGWLGDEPAISRLIELLDEDGGVGQAAATALREIGEGAAPQVLAALRDGDSAARARLLPLVGYAPGAVEAVVACLDDKDASVRALACEALARAANVSVVPGLFRLISDPDPRVSQAAAGAIQALGSVETKRLALIEARSADRRVRRAALRIVSYFGYSEGLEPLVAAIDDDDEQIREAAVGGLALLEDPRALEALFRATNHASAKTRAAAVRALGVATATPEVGERVRAALADGDPWVRYYACRSIAKLHIDAAAPEVIARIHDPAGQVRVAAIDALAQLRDGGAVEALTRATEDADSDIRRAAILGLGTIRDPDTLPTLRAAASSNDAATRLVAISALAEFELPEVVPLLAHAASDPNENVRAAAIGFLGTRPGEAATRALVEQLAFPAVRERVVAALAVAPEGRTESILMNLETADAELARLLVSALVWIRRPSGFAAVAAALTIENVHARRAAAAALAALGTREAADALRHVASVDPDPEVRRLATTATQGR